MLTEDVHTYYEAITYYRVVDEFFLFSRLRPRAHGRCVQSGEDDKNSRTLNVRYDIEIIRDVPITHAKMTMMSQLYN